MTAREEADRIIKVVFDDLCDRKGIGDMLDPIRYDDQELWEEIVAVGRDAIEAAILAERERCATLIDEAASDWVHRTAMAAAIRALPGDAT